MTNLYDFNSAKPQSAPAPSIDADTVRARLRAQALSFVRWLYRGRAFETPRTNPNEARIGNTYGEPGASLSIALRGESAGQWIDHATGESGDLISLYAAFRGLDSTRDFSRILREISSEYFNEAAPVGRPAWEPSAAAQIEERAKQLGTKPRADLIELGTPVATFPYYDMGGNIVASVVRYEPDGTRESKTFRPYSLRLVDGRPKWSQGTPDGLRPLFRLPQIALEQTIVLCEGEGKAQALANLGVAATSAMQGANTPIDKTDWTPLYRKAVIIWPDNDAAGLEYANRVAAHLTHHGAAVRLVEAPSGVRPKWDAADCIAEGGDPHELITQARRYEGKAEAAKVRQRVRLLTLTEIENLPPLTWLVDNILPENSLSMIWGRSGSLKSFVALDIALSVACGRDWHGKPVRKGVVVYLAAEGSIGLARRAMGWRSLRGDKLADADFYLIPHSLTIPEPDDLNALIGTLEAANVRPTLICIDTMSRTFGARNPNQPADMNAYVAAVDRLREATGAHVMVVHHAGEDEGRNEVGNKGLRNACDTVIFVKRARDKVILVNEAPKGKQKDAEEFKAIALRPVKVPYGPNSEHSTLILNLDEEGPPKDDEGSSAEDRRAGLGGIQKRIIDALTQLAGPAGINRLLPMVGAGKSSFYDAMESLLARGLVEKVQSEDGKSNQWKLSQ